MLTGNNEVSKIGNSSIITEGVAGGVGGVGGTTTNFGGFWTLGCRIFVSNPKKNFLVLSYSLGP